MSETMKHLDEIILGDCLEVLPIFPKQSIDLVILDPPYSHFSGSDGETTNLGNYKVLEIFFKNLSFQLKRIIKDTGAIFGFCDFRTYPSLFYGMFYNFSPSNLIIWKKNFLGPGVNFRPIHELIVYWKQSKTPSPKDRNLTDIWEAPRIKLNDKLHFYEKPMKLITMMIENCSNENDVILDPFCGSGTTCLVAIELGRHFIGIEISPKYAELAKTRLKSCLVQRELEAIQ